MASTKEEEVKQAEKLSEDIRELLKNPAIICMYALWR